MKIWTTYFHNIQYLPDSFNPIAISRTVPDFYEGRRLFKLAPTRELFGIGKGSENKKAYIEGYESIVLGELNPDKIAKVIGHNGVILCYENLDKFCHRHLVSLWLRKHGYDVSEYVPTATERVEFDLTKYK